MLAGQDPAAFFLWSVREIGVIMDGAARRDARLAWQAALYARVAYHKPDDMPDDPAERRPPPGGAADEAYVRAYLKALTKRGISDGG